MAHLGRYECCCQVSAARPAPLPHWYPAAAPATLLLDCHQGAPPGLAPPGAPPVQAEGGQAGGVSRPGPGHQAHHHTAHTAIIYIVHATYYILQYK